MSRSYIFKYRRRFFWKKISVTGHKYEKDQDKMVLFLPDGSIMELKKWIECELLLGSDWVLATKEDIADEAGQG